MLNVKVFLRFFILIAVLVIIGIIVVSMSLDALVKTGVETMGPKLLGVPIALGEADVSLLSDNTAMKVSLKKLIIGNPEGYETNYALSIPNIRIRLNRNSILSDTIIIEEILIEDPAIIFDASLLGNNLEDIQDNITRNALTYSDDKLKDKVERHKDNEESGKSFRVKKATIVNAKINLNILDGQIETAPLILPHIELNNIDKESEDSSFQKISAKIFHAIHESIIKAVARRLQSLRNLSLKTQIG